MKHNTAWIVRAKPNVTNRMDVFLEQGIIAIGWHGMGSLDCRSRENIRLMLDKRYPGSNKSSLSSDATEVSNFVNDIQVGDLIVCPDPVEDIVYFGVVTSGYYFVPELDSPVFAYPHQRKVEWKNKVSRKDLPDELLAKFDSYATVRNLQDVKQLVDMFC